jgi:hypothetical protein
VTWWRERNREVDFVVADGRRVLAIEVASGRKKDGLPGLEAFATVTPRARPLLIGAQGLPLERALDVVASDLLGG